MSKINAGRRLSTQAMVLSAETNILAMSEDAQEVASRNPAVAQRLASLVTRARAVQRAAMDLDEPEKPITAAMEQLDADEFRKRVQIRRRMDALRRRGRRRVAKTEFDLP